MKNTEKGYYSVMKVETIIKQMKSFIRIFCANRCTVQQV